MQSPLYNQKGDEIGRVDVPKRIFGLPWNANLVHEVATSMMANARSPVAHTKSRSEVSGGGRKPWRQKGTGRARHGSRRSPLWAGGGVTFGPSNERSYAKKINQKAKTKALFAALSEKLRRGEIIFVDDIIFSESKTREAKQMICALGGALRNNMHTKKANAVAVALPERSEALERSFSNFGNVGIGEIRNLNLLDILRYKYLIIVSPEKSITILKQRMNKEAVNLKS